MTQRLFVYGSLAPGRPNEHLLSELAGTWEAASVTGTLHPEGWGATIGYPAIVLSEDGERVDGFLFTSTELADHWAQLDEFEGDAYERVQTIAKLIDNSTADTYVYVLKRS